MSVLGNIKHYVCSLFIKKPCEDLLWFMLPPTEWERGYSAGIYSIKMSWWKELWSTDEYMQGYAKGVLDLGSPGITIRAVERYTCGTGGPNPVRDKCKEYENVND